MTQPDGRRKTWLGQMETLYNGLSWHIFPMKNFPLSGVSGPGQFPPGSTTVGPAVGSPQTLTLKPDLHIYASDGIPYWMTDVERSTGFVPKLYGFDLARVTEVWDTSAASDYRRLSPSLAPGTRGSQHCKSEFALMRDLMVGVWANDGEIFAGHSLFNPFVRQTPNANIGLDKFTLLIQPVSEAHGAVPVSTPTPTETWRNDLTLGNVDLGSAGSLADWKLRTVRGKNARGTANLADPAHVTIAETALRAGIEDVIAKCETAGNLFAEVIASSSETEKNIYYRPLHEANISFFWWGAQKQTNGSPPPASDPYYRVYRRLFKTCCDAVHQGLVTRYNRLLQDNRSRVAAVSPEDLKNRIQFVMNLNGISEPYTPRPRTGVDLGIWTANAMHIATRSDMLKDDLSKYLKENQSLAFSDGNLGDLQGYVQVLSLDYYEENLQNSNPGTPYLPRTMPRPRFTSNFEPKRSALYTQYLEIARVATQLGVDHALAEVGLRAQYKGKLYGRYCETSARCADIWPSKDRHFFNSVVAKTVDLPGEVLPAAGPDQPAIPIKRPKWVMLWTNRVQNTVLEGPVINGTTPETPVMNGHYDPVAHPTFDDPAVEYYIPSFRIDPANGGFAIGPSLAPASVPFSAMLSATPFDPNVTAYRAAATDFEFFVKTGVQNRHLEVL